MAALMTPWGYTVDAEALPPLMGAADFETVTGGMWEESDERAQAVLAAVSAAIRSYCGWHVSPSLACKCETHGPGRVIGIPAMAVSFIESVVENGEVLASGQYEWLGSGLLRRAGFRQWPARWNSVQVSYTAGLDAAACQDLVAVVAQVASNALAASPGVSNERAGDVSITYNQTASGVTGGIALLQRDKDLLAPYALPRKL